MNYQTQKQKLKSSLTAHIEKSLRDDCLVLVFGRVGFDVRTCDISYDIGLIPVQFVHVERCNSVAYSRSEWSP